MATDAILFMVATAIIAGFITGVCAYLGFNRLLRVLLILWSVLSIGLLLLAMTSASFDRRLFLSLWLYFAVPAMIGGSLTVWSIRRRARGDRS